MRRMEPNARWQSRQVMASGSSSQAGQSAGGRAACGDVVAECRQSGEMWADRRSDRT